MSPFPTKIKGIEIEQKLKPQKKKIKLKTLTGAFLTFNAWLLPDPIRAYQDNETRYFLNFGHLQK